MAVQFVIFAAGLAVLYFGADWLVKAASSIALRFGIRPMVVGLTVVAMGTSMPEFVLNFFAVLADADALAVGNIVGSNIANIGLILGLSAILMPIVVDAGTQRKELTVMVFTMLVFFALASDGMISRFDGGVLVLGLFAFLGMLVFDARRHARANGRTLRGSFSRAPENGESTGVVDIEESRGLSGRARVLYLVGGIVGLSVGAKLMVDSAVSIAEMLNVEPVVIGLSIVAIGTSLPELAASVVCALRKEGDMSVGNILGSNILNVLFVVGLISLMRPLTVLLFFLARFRNSISKIEGAFLLASFSIYMGWLIYPYVQ
jgi:cation:H+ antiporter